MKALVGSRPARIGIILLWLVLCGLGGSFVRRFHVCVTRRFTETGAATAASDDQ